jgi:diguanylate cyclase (GGDEF)-like protein/PAS domain S-box-containing protein
MALVATHGRLLDVNRALCDFFGYDRDELLSRTVEDLTHPQDIATDLDHADKIAAGVSDSYHLRKRYIHADGHVLSGYLTVSGIRNAEGRLEMYLAQVLDLTYEAEMEENLRLLAEHSTEVITRSDPNGRLQWVSPTVTSATGWRPEQLLGRSYLELVHPADRPDVRSMYWFLERDERATITARVIHADGGFSWFAINIDTVRDPDGNKHALIGTLRPNDAEIEAQNLAARRASEFQMLAENASDVVIKIGGDGRITWASPSVTEALGWQPADLVGQQPGDFLHPLDALQMVEDITNLTPQSRSLQRPRRVRRSDHTYEWFAVKASLVTSKTGKEAGRVLGLRNIEVEMRAQAALQASERVFRTAMQAAPGGMAVIGLDGSFQQVNSALAAMVGHSSTWLKEHRLDDILHPEDLLADTQMRRRVEAGDVPSQVRECRLIRPDNSSLWVEHAVGLVRGNDGRPDCFVSQFVDISEARESRRELEFLAAHDPLTRLSNRRALVERMQAALRQIPRTGTRIGVLFLDLDGLKQVNDSLGHAAGDELIVNVAQRVRNAVRTDDIVARLGGDEFVIVLIRVHDLQDATEVAEKVRQSIASPIDANGTQIRVTASFGATLAEGDEGPDQVLERADRLLYEAKARGGNQVLAG